jgi:hypothetical protein
MTRDPEDRCDSRNGSLRCVLRPHDIGKHVGLSPEGSPTASVEWWDRGHETPPTAQAEAFTGEVCDGCGGFRVVRTGKCSTCQDCGTTGGCG